MTDTPRTDAVAHAGHNESVYIARMTYLARELERELADRRAWSSKLADVADDLRAELAAAKDGWTDEICKAQADMRRAETMLNDERKHRAEAQSDYRCLADLLDGHDATECRANLVKLKADLPAERALADRLAEALNESTEGFGDRMSCEESCQCAGRRIVKVNKEALAAWKASRDQNQTKEQL